ncbi:MAG: hypothetical protein K2X93_08460 [Candidatus Obscuribacterales bacterium]|nr:hypothetical protein [Candidatus Obscuribacterales bacterium]
MLPLAPSRHKAVPKAPTGVTGQQSKPTDDGYRIARPGGSSGSAPSSTGADSTRITRPGSTGPTNSNSQSPKGSSADGKSTAPKSEVSDRAAQPSETYPAIGKLEQLTFGVARPDMSIEDRLVSLENAVFGKSYSHDSLFDRTERLKSTLLGKSAPAPSGQPSDLGEPPSGYIESPMGNAAPDAAELQYLDEIVDRPDSHKKAPREVLDSFALELVNYERQRRGLGQLETNHLAKKMAEEHVKDLVERGVTSHSNSKGDNPDKRYTQLGGVDAVTENLAVLNTAEFGGSKPTKAAVARILKNMLMQQDDREALLAPEASHIGFSMEPLDGTRLIACLEVLTNRGVINPVPKSVQLGEKVDVSGEIAAPYLFDRITIAWEGAADLPPQEEGGDEPLPYFPPLDYVAYREKSEKDHSKAIFALKTVGVLAAIAGGMFVPPVALAAPLIMMSGSDPTEPKPVSDIPIKGGVKVAGGSFNSKIPISNDGKEGLYYLTVWASLGNGDKPIAVSRRTIVAKTLHEEEKVSGDISVPKKTDEKSKPPAGEVAKEDVLKTDASKPVDNGTTVKPVVDSDKPLQSTSAPDSKTDSSSSSLPPSTDASNAKSDSVSSKITAGDADKVDSPGSTTDTGKAKTDSTGSTTDKVKADSTASTTNPTDSAEAKVDSANSATDANGPTNKSDSQAKTGSSKATGESSDSTGTTPSADSLSPSKDAAKNPTGTKDTVNGEATVSGIDNGKEDKPAQTDNKKVDYSRENDAIQPKVKNSDGSTSKIDNSKDSTVTKTAKHSESQITSSERESPSIEYTKGEDGNDGARNEHSKTESKESSDDRD